MSKTETPQRVAPKHVGSQGKYTHHLPSLILAPLLASQSNSYQDTIYCPFPPSEGCWQWYPCNEAYIRLQILPVGRPETKTGKGDEVLGDPSEQFQLISHTLSHTL